MDTGEGEEEGANMEDEGEEETMVAEMEMEVVLSLEGKGAVVIHQTGETASLGVAVKAPRHVMKIRLPPGTARRIKNCLELNKMILGGARWLLKAKSSKMMLGQAR